MTTAAIALDLGDEVDLNRRFTEEERDALFEAVADACGEGLATGDCTEAERLVRHYPINPRWAKIIAEVYGKEYLLANFNITYATDVLGEGWLDEIR